VLTGSGVATSVDPPVVGGGDVVDEAVVEVSSTGGSVTGSTSVDSTVVASAGGAPATVVGTGPRGPGAARVGGGGGGAGAGAGVVGGGSAGRLCWYVPVPWKAEVPGEAALLASKLIVHGPPAGKVIVAW
jgi:hypothetical protein